jgi:hypothetical protein
MAALAVAATSSAGSESGCCARCIPSMSKRLIAVTMAAPMSGSKAV